MTSKNLRLPRALAIGAGEEQKSAILSHWNTADSVEEDIERKGFKDKTEPDFECPEIDLETLTGPDNRQYTTMYVRLMAWFGYSSEMLGKTQVRILQYENMLDVLTANTRRQVREVTEAVGGKKPTAEALQDQLLANPEYLDVLRELQRYKQARILLEKKVENIERSLRLVSRQVEIRRLDIEQNKTSVGMPGRGNSRTNFTPGRFGEVD